MWMCSRGGGEEVWEFSSWVLFLGRFSLFSSTILAGLQGAHASLVPFGVLRLRWHSGLWNLEASPPNCSLQMWEWSAVAGAHIPATSVVIVFCLHSGSDPTRKTRPETEPLVFMSLFPFAVFRLSAVWLPFPTFPLTWSRLSRPSYK